MKKFVEEFFIYQKQIGTKCLNTLGGGGGGGGAAPPRPPLPTFVVACYAEGYIYSWVLVTSRFFALERITICCRNKFI